MKSLTLKTILISLLVFFSWACDKKEVSPIVNELVVEGYAYEGHHGLVISVSGQASYDASTGQKPVDGLQITFKNNDINYVLNNSVGGIYFIEDSSLTIAAGNTLSLAFDYQQRPVSATTIVPIKPEGFSVSAATIKAANFGQGGLTTPVTLNWSNPDKSYYFIVVESLDDNAALVDPNRPNVRRFRSQPVQTNATDLRPNSFSYYGLHRIILFKVTTDYAALYNQTNNNSQNITTPPTNIVNGFGIFSATSSDTVQITVTN